MDTPTNSRNLFDDIPANLPDELIQPLLRAKGVKIERIVSRGHHSAPDAWYDQETGEFVVLLRGSAGLRFEGSREVLVMGPGDYVNIPAHVRHRVAWTDADVATVWLAIHYA